MANLKKKQCNKIVYKNLIEAKNAAKISNYISRKIKRGGGKLEPYICNKCKNYHLSKSININKI